MKDKNLFCNQTFAEFTDPKWLCNILFVGGSHRGSARLLASPGTFQTKFFTSARHSRSPHHDDMSDEEDTVKQSVSLGKRKSRYNDGTEDIEHG